MSAKTNRRPFLLLIYVAGLAGCLDSTQESRNQKPSESEPNSSVPAKVEEIADASTGQKTEQERPLSRREQSSKNMKTICSTGIHEYFYKHRFFPRAAITSRENKPLLSWRVSILPFIGEQGLYDQFKLDEPWDSRHNIRLESKMPKVFENPNATKEYVTNYLAVTGKGTMFDGNKKLGFIDVLDGSKNTIMLVEADRYVPWTKPHDFEVDWDDPKKGLGNVRPIIFLAGLVNAEIKPILSKIADQPLKDAFLINQEMIE